jgi:hypothetical protein
MITLKKNFKNFNRLISLTINNQSYTVDAFPYTNELYKKNYIKYPVQSRQAICHDEIYANNERLPTLEERLKGSLNTLFLNE